MADEVIKSFRQWWHCLAVTIYSEVGGHGAWVTPVSAPDLELGQACGQHEVNHTARTHAGDVVRIITQPAAEERRHDSACNHTIQHWKFAVSSAERRFEQMIARECDAVHDTNE